MKTKSFSGLPVILLALAALTLCTGCRKNNEVEDPVYTGPPMITFTTEMNVGDEISIVIDAAEADRADVWIDLNNNGKREASEEIAQYNENPQPNDVINYTLGSQKVTVHGKVTYFACVWSKITSLDASKCLMLKELYCYNNKLTDLNVKGCTALEYLDCNSNQLTNLNLSGCTALEFLDCNGNNLTTLNVSKCPALEILNCSMNQLTTLDVSKCTALLELGCSYNKIKAAEMTQLIASLPTRTPEEKGKIWTSGGENEFTAAHQTAAEKKNWLVNPKL